MGLNKPLRILFFINSVFVFAGALLGPLYAVYVQEIDKRILAVSFSWAVFMFASTGFMYLISKFGDRIKEKEYLLAGGFLVRAIAWLGYLFVTDITGLILVQIILGFGEALGTPSWGALFADHLNVRREIMEYSKWSVVSNIMVAFGVLMGGLIVTFYGFRVIFILMSFLAFISFVGTLLTPRRVL
jgi:MFS family permease